MGYVCPKDVKKMLLQRARTVYWKKWAAKHEIEELKEGVWLEPALALSRKKTKGDWTEKHRNVARKMLLEGGRVQQRLFDFGWSNERECQACHKTKGTEKRRLYYCPEPHEIRIEIPEAFRKWEQTAKTSKKEWKWHKGIVVHLLSESQWNRATSVSESGSPRNTKAGVCHWRASRAMWPRTAPCEERAGQWGACWWAVVQLDYDEEMGPLHGMYGSVEADIEVQRTIKRAELMAFFCFLKRGSMPTTKELLMGRGEEKESA